MKKFLFLPLAFFLSLQTYALERVKSNYVYHIDATNPLSAIFLPGSVGTSPSPNPSFSEMDEAFLEFENPQAAIDQLENIKRGLGVTRGSLFVRVDYDSDRGANMRFVCGISGSESDDTDVVTTWRSKVRETSSSRNSGGIKWRNFKASSRKERVREIASCFSRLKGMPKLRSTSRPKPKEVYMDKKAKRDSISWMRSELRRGEIATDAQLYKAFKCMLVKAANATENASGDKIIFRTFDYESERTVVRQVPAGKYGPFTFVRDQVSYVDHVTKASLFAVVSTQEAVERIYNSDEIDSDEITGLWPMRVMGEFKNFYDGEGRLLNRYFHQFEAVGVYDQMDACKVKAGIDILPDLNPNDSSRGQAPSGC